MMTVFLEALCSSHMINKSLFELMNGEVNKHLCWETMDRLAPLSNLQTADDEMNEAGGGQIGW